MTINETEAQERHDVDAVDAIPESARTTDSKTDQPAELEG